MTPTYARAFLPALLSPRCRGGATLVMLSLLMVSFAWADRPATVDRLRSRAAASPDNEQILGRLEEAHRGYIEMLMGQGNEVEALQEVKFLLVDVPQSQWARKTEQRLSNSLLAKAREQKKTFDAQEQARLAALATPEKPTAQPSEAIATRGFASGGPAVPANPASELATGSFSAPVIAGVAGTAAMLLLIIGVWARRKTTTATPQAGLERALGNDPSVSSVPIGAESDEDMAGNLGKMSIINYLQLINQEGHSGVMTVKSPKGVGTIILTKGEIARASYGGQNGTRALFRLFDCHEGTFSFRAQDIDEARAIKGSIHHLIMDFLRRKDEAERDAKNGNGVEA